MDFINLFLTYLGSDQTQRFSVCITYYLIIQTENKIGKQFRVTIFVIQTDKRSVWSDPRSDPRYKTVNKINVQNIVKFTVH